VAIASPTPIAKAVRSAEVMAMASSIEEANAKVRSREDCRVCGDDAGDGHAWKFMSAGGALAGPFCSRDCQFEFLTEDREVSDAGGGDEP